MSTSVPAMKRSARRKSPWRARLTAMHRYWYFSFVSLLIEEIGNTCLRIGALCRKPSASSRRALVFPYYPDDVDPLPFLQDGAYQRAYSEYIQHVSRERRWVNVLDQQIMMEAYFAGLLWALRNCGKNRRKE